MQEENSTMNEIKDPNDTSTRMNKQVAKQPTPNRKQRRSYESIVAHAKKKNALLSAKKQAQYESLQLWLSTQTKLSKEEADEVFKRVVKKIIKKDLCTLGAAITASIRSLKDHPLIIATAEVKSEN